MTTEIKAPTFPESVQDGTIVAWHKQVGDTVMRDEILVEVETDKVVLEVPATAEGVLSEIVKGEGDVVESNDVLGLITVGAVAASSEAATPAPSEAPGGRRGTAPAGWPRRHRWP